MPTNRRPPNTGIRCFVIRRVTVTSDTFLAGADLAIDYLLNLLTPRPPCEHCGRSDADRDPVVVRACQLVLDRSGYGPSATMQVVSAPDNPYADLTEDELIKKIEALLKRCYESRDFDRQQEQARLGEGVIDAVVDEGFEVPEDDTFDSLSSSEPDEEKSE